MQYGHTKYGLSPLVISGAVLITGVWLTLPLDVHAEDRVKGDILLSEVKSKRDDFNRQLKDRKSRLKARQQDFSKNIRRKNKDISELIAKKWQEFELKAGKKNPYRRQPKPRTIKPLPPPKDPSADRLPTPQLPEKLKRARPLALPTLPSQPDAINIKIDAWGSAASFQIPRALVAAMPQNDQITENDVSKYWDATSDEAIMLLSQLRAVRARLALNDWGYVLLLHKIARAVFPARANARALWVWQMTKMAQMDARLALAENQTLVLLASRQVIFEAPRLTINRTHYYMAPLPGEAAFLAGQRLKTYPGDNRKTSARAVDLQMRRAPLIWKASGEPHELSFSFGGRKFRLEVPVNQAMLDYMADFPLADFSVFVDAPLSPQTAQALKAQLAPIIAELARADKASAVNFLLRFVQTAFRYQNDIDRIGKEDYFFGEETLNAKLSDCEDRVALFGWLATNLLGLETVAVFWPGHLAAAVRLDGAQGRGITYRGRHYIYADPTFINANIGRAVPPFEAKKPARVIPIGH